MAELLAANQITIAKVLDGENGEDGYSPTVTTGTSSDGSTTVTVTNKDGSNTTTLVDGTARADIDNLSDKTRSGFIETLSGSGFVQSTKTEDGGTTEVIVYGKSVQDGTPWIGTEVDSAPYLNRAMPSQSNDYNRESLKIVGGTVAWNQFIPDSNRNYTNTSVTDTKGYFEFVIQEWVSPYRRYVSQEFHSGIGEYSALFKPSSSTTGVTFKHNGKSVDLVMYTIKSFPITANHVYMFTANFKAVDIATIGGVVVQNLQFFDLTQMFGSTIADYIYSLEQTTAGAGVAWFKKLFPNDYYEYNAGELLSVEGLQSHDTVGFNQWDEEWEVGNINHQTGAISSDSNNIRSKNFIPVFPLTEYYYKAPSTTAVIIVGYDADYNYVKSLRYNSSNAVFTTSDSSIRYIKFCTRPDTANYGNIYKNDICINLSNPTRNGEYEPYEKHSYPLDSSLTLRGIPKLDASNNLYYDGDEYTSDGKVKRNTILRAYQSGDESLANAITDGTNTVVYSANASTETATPYTNLQIVDPDGTEEFVSTGILPVGHNSTYLLVCPISVCDNVSVSVKGKNLFDINKIVPNNMFVENGELHLANASGGNDNIQNGQKLSDLANLEVGETYTLSANSTYSNKVIYLNTSEKGWAFGTSTVITQEDLDSRIGWYGNGAIISNIQIELGSTATDYEPYQAKTATLSDIVLRSTPDGTRDRLFKDTDGLWKVERNCAYISSYNGESITTSYYSNTGELSTGASVVYALEAPTYETLPDSIQAELNALTTYNPVTNVMVSDGVTPDIDVSFWTRDYYAKNAAENAAKVATNFIGYDSTNGLIIGNKTSGTWSGYHSQILPDSFNILDESSTVLASFGTTTVIGEEAKANMHLTFNNFSMVDKNDNKFFEVGDNRNAEGIATIKHTAMVVANSTGSATVTVDTYILSIISVYADSVQLSSSSYSFSQKDVTINNLTANSQTSIEITYTTDDPSPYLTFGNRDSSGKIGRYSVAEGQYIIASGQCSHAEGSHTEASGTDSHAEGNGTNATGRCSHAEGVFSTASADESHAEGYNTKASGEQSHAEGYSSKASGEYSHAEGRYSEASGKGSHAGGYYTKADGNYMTAIGKYNTRNSNKAFVIGNGTSDTSRSNALAVDWNGNLTLGTPLSVENGGTGATTAAAARANLEIYQRELVWENANDTLKFAAQTIELDLSSYDYVEVHFFVSSTYQERVVGIGAVHDRGYRIYAQVMSDVDTSDTIYVTQRVADVRASDVTFSDAYTKFITSTSTQQNNNRMVPTKIYAFKV